MAKKKVSAKKAAAPKAAFGSKAEFIRAQSSALSAKEVVEAAAKDGLTMTENHVYTVRAEAKKKLGNPATTSTPKRTTKTTKTKTARTPSVSEPKLSDLEAQLRRAIGEMGLAKARAIFAEVERAFAGG